MPPPMTLPRHVTSGAVARSSCAPPRARRNPVMTSSNMRSAPVSDATRRSPSRNPSTGGGHPEARAKRRLFGDRGDDRWMGVSRDQRSPRADEIDVRVAVGVADSAALASHDERRLAPDGTERAHGARNATGHAPRRALVEG